MSETLDRPCTSSGAGGQPPSSPPPSASPPPSPPPPGFKAGDLIAGRYRLERLLGRGGHGEVWEAVDKLGAGLVAVKLLRPSMPLDLARARKESLALRILRLPGVVRLLDEGVEGAYPFLVMERVEGTPFPGEGRRGSWEAIAEVAVALLETLARIHAAGVIHRDLKPENVLVNAEGRPIVLDFGVSVGERLGQRLTDQRWIVGTPAYLAPEQFLGEPATVRTDLYAYGLLLYEALAGQPPHDAQDLQGLYRVRLAERAPPLRSRAPGVPAVVAGLVDLLLSRDPEGRPRSAAEVLSILQGEPIPALSAPVLPRLDGQEPVERALHAVRAGRSVEVVGARYTGRTRCLQEVSEALRQEGVRVGWAVPGYQAFASLERVLAGLGEGAQSLHEVEEAVDGKLREELAGGMVLMLDDAERLDAWSAKALARCSSAGVVVRALLEEAPERGTEVVRLEPVSMADLEALFSGPERVFHLRSDAARMLWMRTEGLQARVAEELTAWLRAGIARRDGDRVAVDRESLDSLEAGMRVLLLDRSALFEAPAGVPLPAHLEELEAWIAVASPVAAPGLIAAAMNREPWKLEADLQDLQERGRVRRLGDGRVELRGGSQAAQGWSSERRRGAHRAIADTLPQGADGRLLHLIQGAGSDEVAGADALEIGHEAEMLARRLAQEGWLGQAVAALEQGLLVTRRSAASLEERSALEGRLLSCWVEVAVLARRPEAYARVHYELSRAESRTPEITHLEELVRAVMAWNAGGERSLTLLDAVLPFRDVALERERQRLRLSAARHCSLGIEEAVLKEIAAWVGQAADVTTRARYSGWLGRLRYRQGRFDEAAALHIKAAEREPWVAERVAEQLNAASALMEAFRHREAAAYADVGRRQARECRHVFHEARAEWILRSTAYRMGEAEDPDLELLAAVEQVGVVDVEAALCLNEAAVAYRRGDARRAVELAGRSGDIYAKTHQGSSALLGRCLALAAGAPQDPDEVERLVDGALEERVSGIGIQALGLLARAGVAPRTRWTRGIHALTAKIPTSCWHLRMDVLSVNEALEALGVQRPRVRAGRRAKAGAGNVSVPVRCNRP